MWTMIRHIYQRHLFSEAVSVARYWGFKRDFLKLYKHYRKSNYDINIACYEALFDLDLFCYLSSDIKVA